VTSLVHEVNEKWGIRRRSDSAAGAAEAEQLQLLRNLQQFRLVTRNIFGGMGRRGRKRIDPETVSEILVMLKTNTDRPLAFIAQDAGVDPKNGYKNQAR
jgi:hypothetical protein